MKCLYLWNLALQTWRVQSHCEKSWLLSYWSLHQSFKPKCWIPVVICLARNISLISWYRPSIDYLQNWLRACSIPTPGFPVGKPVMGEGENKWLCMKSICVWQFPSQIPKEKCLKKHSFVVSDQNVSAGSRSSNAQTGAASSLVLCSSVSRSHRTPATVCSLIKGHKEWPPAVPSEAKAAGTKSQPYLLDQLPNSDQKMSPGSPFLKSWRWRRSSWHNNRDNLASPCLMFRFL